MAFIDSHCHIVMSDFDGDRQQLLTNYFASGGAALMSVSTSREDFEMNRDLVTRYDHLYVSLGWHPHDASSFNTREIAFLQNAIDGKQIHAVGEIGLDYYYTHSDRADQLRAFEQQMTMAGKAELPVIIHTRQADEDTIRMLKRHPNVRGVLHCYTSGPELLEVGLLLDYFVSFSGIITFPKSTELRDILNRVPIDRLLFETDSPYLAPVPFRGKRNDPAKVKTVIQCAAELRGMPFDTLSEQANKNFFELFGQ